MAILILSIVGSISSMQRDVNQFKLFLHYFKIVRTGDKLENAPEKASVAEDGQMLPVIISFTLSEICRLNTKDDHEKILFA